MDFKTRWAGIKSRAASLVTLGTWFHGHTGPAAEAAMAGAALKLKHDVEAFLSDLGGLAPPELLAGWKTAISFYGANKSFDGTSSDGRVIALTSAISEIDAQLSDDQVAWVARAERAFEHLRRSLVVDDDLRSRWKAAFDPHQHKKKHSQDEVAIEKLGAAHLLAHGLWAFKASGTAGGRTDLVFPDASGELTANARRADAPLVLTEWKLVRAGQKAEGLATGARAQADAYGSGVLGGFELRRVRYVVLVSMEGGHILPDARVEGPSDGIYRHIDLAIDPAAPSAKRSHKPARGRGSRTS
ncbi:MAG: hypothetical protein QM723_18410 [Myxococcaceae bacterium]